MIFHLYAKLTERLDVFDAVLDALHVPAADLRFSCEHELAWHALDDLIGAMRSGDSVCVPALETLGGVPDDITARISGVIGRNGRIVICSVPATYEFGLDSLLNRAVVNAIMQGIRAAPGGVAAFVRPAKAGRPAITFPDGWDEMYMRWESGELTSKEFLDKSGLKKATFYNKLADYKALREYNLRYLAEHGIA